MITDLASKLRPFIAVIVVDIDVRSIAERTESLLRDFGRIRAVFNRRKRFSVIRLILNKGIGGLTPEEKLIQYFSPENCK